MSRKRNYKQTRRAVSISGDLYAAIRAHCERAGLSISGYAEMVLRREMGMQEREGHLERSPILVEAHKASKSSKKPVPDPVPPTPAPKPEPTITGSYEPPIVFRVEREKREPPAPETTFRQMGGRIEPLPGKVEPIYPKDSQWSVDRTLAELEVEGVVELQGEVEIEIALPPEEDLGQETESDYQQIDFDEIPQDSEELALEPASEPISVQPEIPQDSEELEPEASQNHVFGLEDGQVPDEDEQFERESDPGELESEVEEPEAESEPDEDPRPIRAIRTDRPSREFMSKGERERLERARRIAEKEKAEAAKLKEAQEKEAKEENPSRLAGNVFSF